MYKKRLENLYFIETNPESLKKRKENTKARYDEKPRRNI